MEEQSIEVYDIYFVLPTGCQVEDVSNIMKLTFQACMEKCLDPQWIEEASTLHLTPNKKTIFILDEFEGPAFEHLRKVKAVLFGPWCISTCLTEGLEVPQGPSPCYNDAMRDIVVSTTNFKLEERLKELVQFMGGVYSEIFTKATTHLLANGVQSKKYEVALTRNTPVMTRKWVDAVWEASRMKRVQATDDEFQRYICPIFYRLFVSCSNLSRAEKMKIKELVEENGGVFTTSMKCGETKILVVGKPEGAKYRGATSWHIPCVSPAWIFACVEQKACINVTPYLVGGPAANSTIRGDHTVALDDPSVSTILHEEDDKTHISASSLSTTCTSMPSSAVRTKAPVPCAAVDAMSFQQAKDAGTFLDGCQVFLTGFTQSDLDKLRRILNCAGATRFNELSDCVSHVVVGDVSAADLGMLDTLSFRPHVVTASWLLESMLCKAPAPEQDFQCGEKRQKVAPVPVPSSPLSKKGAHLLQPHCERRNTPPVQNVENSSSVANAADLVQEYLAEPSSEPEDEPSKKSLDGPLAGMTFLLTVPDAEAEPLEVAINKAGGILLPCQSDDPPDYVVVNPHQKKLPAVTGEVVTRYWVEDCILNDALLPVEYWHRPYGPACSATILAECVVALSQVLGLKRLYLMDLALALGARFEDNMARCTKMNSDGTCIYATTHLVTELAESKKYEGALKWGVPVVHPNWLLECARQGRRVSEVDYLIGASRSVSAHQSRISDAACQKTFAQVAPKPTTPISTRVTENRAKDGFKTPVTARHSGFSQETPINIPRPSVDTSGSSSTPVTTPRSPNHIDTPDTPYGQVLYPNPSPETRKRMLRFIDSVPQFPRETYPPPKIPKTDSPTMTDLFDDLWAKIGGKFRRNPVRQPTVPASESEETNRVQLTTAEDLSPARILEPSVSVSENAQSPSDKELDAALEFLQQKKRASRTTNSDQSTSWNDIGSDMSSHLAVADLSALQCSEREVTWTQTIEEQVSRSKQEEPFVFMISGVSAQDRKEYGNTIRKLGGVLDESQSMGPSVTHLICEVPGRHEKTLAAIATGKWVLSTSYVLASQAAGAFVDETTHEWGSPQAAHLLARLAPGSTEYSIALAAHRWRLALASGKLPAFHGLKVLLHTSPTRSASVAKLVVSGDGCVIPPERWEEANLCLIELGRTETPVDLAALARREIPCVPPVFLNDLLINDPPPSAADKVIPEYSKLVSVRRR